MLSFLKKFKDYFVPSKIYDVRIEGKKAKFTKELALIKYERQHIPLPKVTEHKLTKEEYREKQKREQEELDEQTAMQCYYLIQFTEKGKRLNLKIKSDLPKKASVKFISMMHFLAYKNSFQNTMGSSSVNVYKPNVTSVNTNKSQVRT